MADNRPKPVATDEWVTVSNPANGNGEWQTIGAPTRANEPLPGSTARLRQLTGAPEEPGLMQKAASYAPMVLGGIGGLVGNVPGAVAGGMGGEALNLLAQRDKNSPPPSVDDAMKLGLEGVKQGAYEVGGRALTALGGLALGKLRGTPIPAVGQTIKGVEIPETMGQAWGNPGGLTQKIEHYLSGTFLGSPLRAVRAAQEDASRQIMAKLSGVGMANPTELAGNWAQAREATRAIASPMYESLGKIDAPAVHKVAQDILSDTGLRLSAKAKQALTAVGEDPAMGLAQSLGYANTKQANAKMGQATFQSVMQKFGITPATPKVGDALKARHELSDMAAHASDPADARLLRIAADQLDAAIEASLTPAQQAVKEQADLLWRRSYIMNKISDKLGKMENAQDPNAAPMIATKGFVKMVNELARNPTGRDAAGNIIQRPSQLDILFDNPSDRAAIKDLASFLAAKSIILRGGGGIGESIANIGTALSALHLPVALATGHVAQAATSGSYLAGLYGASKILASPGGAKALRAYFSSPQAGQVALAGRILGLEEGQK